MILICLLHRPETACLFTQQLKRHQRSSKIPRYQGVRHPLGSNETLRSNPNQQSQGMLASESKTSPLLTKEQDSVTEDNEIR